METGNTPLTPALCAAAGDVFDTLFARLDSDSCSVCFSLRSTVKSLPKCSPLQWFSQMRLSIVHSRVRVAIQYRRTTQSTCLVASLLPFPWTAPSTIHFFQTVNLEPNPNPYRFQNAYQGDQDRFVSAMSFVKQLTNPFRLNRIFPPPTSAP